MSRSSKKGPYIDQKLMKKVLKQGLTSSDPIKTWARDSQIAPEFVGKKFLIHNGKDFKEVLIVEGMVGHRLGEFSPTRNFKGHGQVVKRILEKT